MPADEPTPAKRHLPILQDRPAPPAPSAPAPAPEEERPPWRRVSLGTTATFLVWLPLLVLIETLTERWTPSAASAAAATDAPAPAWAGPAILAAHTAVFLLAAFAGGAVTGRLGADRPRREGALAGAAAALVAWLLTLSQGARGGALVWTLLLLILASLGAGAGALGGRTGARLRPLR